MADSAVCCGFGGTFSFEHPDVANFVLESKLANITATGADIVITDNPGCLTHLRGGLDARNQRVIFSRSVNGAYATPAQGSTALSMMRSRRPSTNSMARSRGSR